MSEKPSQTSRPWRQVARDLINETDPQRVTELSRELAQAIDEQTRLSGGHDPAAVVFPKKRSA